MAHRTWESVVTSSWSRIFPWGDGEGSGACQPEVGHGASTWARAFPRASALPSPHLVA